MDRRLSWRRSTLTEALTLRRSAASASFRRESCDLVVTRKHETYENIRRNGQVVVSLVAPPDIAVSIKGHAKVAKERMELVNTDAVIEVGVEEVKDDLIPGSFIVSGILYSVEKHVKDFITKYIDEVRKA